MKTILATLLLAHFPMAAAADPAGVYDARGRRDPFVGYREPGNDVARPSGIRGMKIAELDLQGIVLSADGERMALVLGSDDKGYTLREGDAVFDGKLEKVEADRVRFLRHEDDPLTVSPYVPVVIPLDPTLR